MSDPITPESMPALISKLKMACDADKDYQMSITPLDNGLKARQRALAKIWYKTIANEQGMTLGEAEALCKYRWGLAIRCENDPDLEKIVRRMLDGHAYEEKLKIIERYPEWFPILRDKGGMDAEQQGRYLSDIQRGFAEQGVFLSSSNEKELLNCKAAN
jgi:hypothetical protein